MQQFARADPALYIRQLQRRQIAAQPYQRVVERHVGGELGQPGLVEPGPGAHTAGTAFDVGRVIDPGAPRRQVDRGQVGIELAAPLGQVAKRGAVQVGAQVEGIGEVTRWRAAQGDAVARAGIARHQMDVCQGQFGRAAQFVIPAQARLADHDAALAENPVGHRAATAIVCQFNAANRKLAITRAPDVKVGVGDVERMQAQVQGRHRPPRQRHRHVGQAEGGTALGVVHHHITQVEARIQAIPAGPHAPDQHLVAGRPCKCRFNVGAVVLDAGQHHVAQRQNHERKQEKHGPRQALGPDQRAARGTGDSLGDGPAEANCAGG